MRGALLQTKGGTCSLVLVLALTQGRQVQRGGLVEDHVGHLAHKRGRRLAAARRPALGEGLPVHACGELSAAGGGTTTTARNPPILSTLSERQVAVSFIAWVSAGGGAGLRSEKARKAGDAP